MKINDVLRIKGDAVASVPSSAGIREALNELARHNVGALVVRDAGEPNSGVAGILSERDVVRRLHSAGVAVLDATVVEVMTTDVVTCSPDDDVEQVMRVMTERHVRHLPVVAAGKLVGIVSIGDVVKNRIDELETSEKQLVSYISSGG